MDDYSVLINWSGNSCFFQLLQYFHFNYQLIDFLLLSVVSLLLSIMLIICYSMAVHTVFTGEQVGSFSWYSYNRTPDQNVTRTKTLTTFVLFFSCLEFLLCLGSIAYVGYAYRRDFKRKPVRYKPVQFDIWGNIVIWDCFCFASVRFFICYRNSHLPLNQSDTKLKPVVTWSTAFWLFIGSFNSIAFLCSNFVLVFAINDSVTVD